MSLIDPRQLQFLTQQIALVPQKSLIMTWLAIKMIKQETTRKETTLEEITRKETALEETTRDQTARFRTYPLSSPLFQHCCFSLKFNDVKPKVQKKLLLLNMETLLI